MINAELVWMILFLMIGLWNQVVFLSLENKPVENVAYGFRDERTMNHEFTMHRRGEERFKTISLSRILGIEQI